MKGAIATIASIPTVVAKSPSSVYVYAGCRTRAFFAIQHCVQYCLDINAKFLYYINVSYLPSLGKLNRPR